MDFISQSNSNNGIQKLPVEKLKYIFFPAGIESKKSDYYKLACLYMGLTELYDRCLTSKRSHWDDTEAFIDSYIRPFSQKYENYIRKSIVDNYFVKWSNVQEEIKKHNYYSAQQWVNEYERIWNQHGGN